MRIERSNTVITKMFETPKEAKAYMREQKKGDKITHLHAKKEHLSYRGKNKTFYYVTVEDRKEIL
jgi:NADH:ubiquinone oxidoreductase subunit D